MKTFPLIYQLLLGDFSSSAQVKIVVKIQLWTLKKNQIFVFPFCSTLEHISIDVLITNEGLISSYRRSQGDFFSRGTDKIQFSQFQTFLIKKNQLFGFPWCSTREDLSIDLSIIIVGVILTKLRWFQLLVISQNLNFKLFEKKKKIGGSHGVVHVKTFLLMYHLLM